MNQREAKKVKELILSTLKEKAAIKQKVYDNTADAFALLKEVLHEVSKEYNESLGAHNSEVRVEFSDRGSTEAELCFASDMLLFNFQPNVFEFDREHSIWTSSYVQDDALNSFVGIISIYNFLSDSVKYNRMEDLGYLIARIHVNRQKHYFVEGKRQLGFLYNDFANSLISKKSLRDIVDSSMLYCLDFDLLVPNYDDVSIVTVEQMMDKISKSKVQTGKRLGFRFYPDDDKI
jgi:hypothetical protein